MIEQIIIENYKSIKHAKLRLNGINVLIGSNGAGKSNFISFLELSKNIINQNLGSYILSNGGIDRFLYRGRKTSDHIDGLIDFNNNNAFYFRLKPSIGDKAFIEYDGDFYNWKNDKTKSYESLWSKAVHDKAVEESDILNKSYRVKYIKDYFNEMIVYHFHDTSKTSGLRTKCNIDDNSFLRHDGSNLAAFLYNMKKTAPKEFSIIEGIVRQVAPYFHRFNLSPSRDNGNSIKLEWEEKGSDAYLDAYNFSDGTIRFIALASLLLQPTPPSIIIIDEPELGLHPSAINLLTSLIKKASLKSQIIIATQSVNIVDNFNPEDIIVVNHTDGQTSFNHLDTSELQGWLESYSLGEIWEKNIIGGKP